MLTLLLVSLVLAGPSKSPDSKGGWKELRWGTVLPENMRCGPKTDGQAVCTLGAASGDRAVGDVTLDNVEYLYFEDRLVQVMLTLTNNKTNMNLLQAGLVQAYGESKERLGVNSMTWTGDRVRLIYESDGKGAAKIVYQYRPLYDDMAKASAKADPSMILHVAEDL